MGANDLPLATSLALATKFVALVTECFCACLLEMRALVFDISAFVGGLESLVGLVFIASMGDGFPTVVVVAPGLVMKGAGFPSVDQDPGAGD